MSLYTTLISRCTEAEMKESSHSEDIDDWKGGRGVCTLYADSVRGVIIAPWHLFFFLLQQDLRLFYIYI